MINHKQMWHQRVQMLEHVAREQGHLTAHTFGLQLHADVVAPIVALTGRVRMDSWSQSGRRAHLWRQCATGVEGQVQMIDALPTTISLFTEFKAHVERNRDILSLILAEAVASINGFPSDEFVRDDLIERGPVSQQFTQAFVEVIREVAREDAEIPLPEAVSNKVDGLARSPLPGMTIEGVELSARAKRILPFRIGSQALSDGRLKENLRAWETDLLDAFSGEGGLVTHPDAPEFTDKLRRFPRRSKVRA